MSASPRLVVLVGPTAVGKTAATAALCAGHGAEVISADSVQVYQGLDIGSAKPTAAELAAAPHHLLDVVAPDQPFDAAQFARLADQAMAEISARGKRVLVAGGTGLYIRALLFGLAPAPPVDPKLRAALAQEWQEKGPQALHQRLAALDPASAQRLAPRDRQRVLRALEVCLSTGQPLSARHQAHGFSQPRHEHLLLGLTRPRSELNRRIEERCRQMWAEGLLEETRDLLARGVDPAAKCMQSLGYKQAVAVLRGELDGDAALREMMARTRAYAKRQGTWFRAQPGVIWRHPDQVEELVALAGRFWAGEEMESLAR